MRTLALSSSRYTSAYWSIWLVNKVSLSANKVEVSYTHAWIPSLACEVSCIRYFLLKELIALGRWITDGYCGQWRIERKIGSSKKISWHNWSRQINPALASSRCIENKPTLTYLVLDFSKQKGKVRSSLPVHQGLSIERHCIRLGQPFTAIKNLR